jgi:hypothetical protein
MIHNKILYATIVFLISFSCVGFAAENANYYNDGVRVNDLMGENVDPILLDNLSKIYSTIDWVNTTTEIMEIREAMEYDTNHRLKEIISTTS